MKIVNFGSLNVDYVYRVPHVIVKGETLASTSRNIFSGGKGLNQSVALSRAGLPVYHAGCIGQGGEILLDVLKDSGVNTDFVRNLPDVPVGHTIIQNTDDGDNCIILFGGANQAVSEEQVDETLSHFEEGDWIVLQNEISCLKYIMEKAHERGMNGESEHRYYRGESDRRYYSREYRETGDRIKKDFSECACDFDARISGVCLHLSAGGFISADL